MKSQGSPTTRGDQIPEKYPSNYTLSFEHLPLTQKKQMLHPCGAPLENIGCPYLPTPPGHCSTPLRRHLIESNGKSPRWLAPHKFACQPGKRIVFPRCGKAAHPRKSTTASAVRLSPERTARGSDSPRWQRHIHEMAMHDSQNTFLRNDSVQCSTNSPRLAGQRGITPAEDVPLREDPRIYRKDANNGKVHSAAVHKCTTGARLKNIFGSNFLDKTTQQRPHCDAHPSAARGAVDYNGGAHSNEKVGARVTLLNDGSSCAENLNHKSSCCAVTGLQTHPVFISHGSHAAYKRGEDQVLRRERLPHPAAAKGRPNLTCQETFVEDDCGNAALECKFHQTPPCVPNEENSIYTTCLQLHTCDGESPRQARSELSALNPESCVKREDTSPGINPRPRVRHALASSAFYDAWNCVASFQSAGRRDMEGPLGFPGRPRREVCDGINEDSFVASQADYSSPERRTRSSISTPNMRMKTINVSPTNDSTCNLHNSDDVPQAHSARGSSYTGGLQEESNKDETQENGIGSQVWPCPAVVEPAHFVKPPVHLVDSGALGSSVSKEKDLITHEQIVTFLERCSTMSIYGPDVESGDPSSSPFHSSRQPSISLRDYYFNRIVKYSKMSPTDLVIAVVYINKLLKARSPTVTTNHATAEGQRSSKPAKEYAEADMQNKHSHPNASRKAANEEVDTEEIVSASETASTAFSALDAVEFNVLTAHRLLLTASLLANKVQYDRHLVLKHWAKLGGLEKEEVVSLEATFLRIIDWRVLVSVEDFLLVRESLDLRTLGEKLTCACGDHDPRGVLRMVGALRSKYKPPASLQQSDDQSHNGRNSWYNRSFMQTRYEHTSSLVCLLQTCRRIALADVSLFLKTPATKSGGYILPRHPIASEATAREDKSRVRQSVDNLSVPVRGVCCLPTCEDKVVRMPSMQADSEGGRSTSTSVSDSPQIRKTFEGTKSTALDGRASAMWPHSDRPPNDSQQISARGSHHDKATMGHPNTGENCNVSGHARKAPSVFSMGVTPTETRKASEFRHGLPRLKSPSVRATVDVHKASIKCLKNRRAGFFASEQCNSSDACTNASARGIHGKYVESALPNSLYASAQLQFVQQKMGIYRDSHNTAPGCAPPAEDCPASGSSVMRYAPPLSRRFATSQEASQHGTWHPSLRRQSLPTEIVECTGSTNSATAAPNDDRHAVAPSILPPGNCEDTLHVVQAESPTSSTCRRELSESSTEDNNGLRPDVHTAYSSSALNRVPNASSRKSIARNDSFKKISRSLEQNLATASRQLLTAAKSEAKRPGSCSGNTYTINRRDLTTGYLSEAYEMRRTTCIAPAPRITTGYSLDEWKTTTATPIEGISQIEELGICHSPRHAANQTPHKRRIQLGRGRHIDPQTSCNRFVEPHTNTDKLYYYSYARPAAVGEQALSMCFPPDRESTLVLPVW